MWFWLTSVNFSRDRLMYSSSSLSAIHSVSLSNTSIFGSIPQIPLLHQDNSHLGVDFPPPNMIVAVNGSGECFTRYEFRPSSACFGKSLRASFADQFYHLLVGFKGRWLIIIIAFIGWWRGSLFRVDFMLLFFDGLFFAVGVGEYLFFRGYFNWVRAPYESDRTCVFKKRRVR